MKNWIKISISRITSRYPGRLAYASRIRSWGRGTRLYLIKRGTLTNIQEM